MDFEDKTILNQSQKEGWGFNDMPFGIAGSAGLGLMGASAMMMRNQTPGGTRLLTADYAKNYLDDFYKTGGPLPPEMNKRLKYIQEAVNTGGRITKDMLFGLQNTEFYYRTGVSPVLMQNIKDIDITTDAANEQYLKGKISKKQAVHQIKKAEKIAFFKASSDKANRIIFHGQSSPELDNIVGDTVKRSSKKEFLKSLGGSSQGKIRLANYVISRQPDIRKVGLDDFSKIHRNNFAFIKYGNLNFADVLRGMQFDRNTYNAMLALKGVGLQSDVIPGLNTLQRMGINNARPISGNKLAFSISPSIRPNYDWGGYNGVGVWDRRNPGKIRFIATDVPNALLPKVTGGKIIGLKYVDSREITITDPKIKEIVLEKEISPERRAAALKGWETRRANQLKNGIKPPPIDDEIFTRNPVIGKGRMNALRDLQSKRKSFSMGIKQAAGKLGRRSLGAAGIALMAFDLVNAFSD